MNEKDRTLFIEYWERRRKTEKNFFYQLLTGLPVGLLFALPIVFILITSKYWFKRADMAAHSSPTSAGVVAGAALFIASFVAVLYKRHQWEMKEQQYQEFKRMNEGFPEDSK